MNSGKYCIKQLNADSMSIIRDLFVSVFSNDPWNDDWSDKNQLNLYIYDLVGQNNSLTFGIYEENELIGISM